MTLHIRLAYHLYVLLILRSDFIQHGAFSHVLLYVEMQKASLHVANLHTSVTEVALLSLYWSKS